MLWKNRTLKLKQKQRSSQMKLFFVCFWSLVGYSALHMAAAWNRVESVQVLIDSGADYAIKNSYNETAKDVAERYGNRSCINYLDTAGIQRWHTYSLAIICYVEW